jgi:hypothetical protein
MGQGNLDRMDRRHYNFTTYNSDQIGITTLLLIAYASKQLQMVCNFSYSANSCLLHFALTLPCENDINQFNKCVQHPHASRAKYRRRIAGVRRSWLTMSRWQRLQGTEVVGEAWLNIEGGGIRCINFEGNGVGYQECTNELVATRHLHMIIPSFSSSASPSTNDSIDAFELACSTLQQLATR